ALALAQIGGPGVVEALIAALDDADQYVVGEACSGLGRFDDPRAIESLMRMLDHSSWSVGRDACLGLIELGAADAGVIAVMQGLIREPVAGVNVVWKDRLRWQLAELRGSYQEEKQQALEAALLELRDPDAKV